MPVTVVFGMLVHAFCRGAQPGARRVAHTFGTPPAPQMIWPVAQLPPIRDAAAAVGDRAALDAAARARHACAAASLPPPHANNVPSPPQKSGGVHVPHSITPPQPSPIGPHVAFRLARHQPARRCVDDRVPIHLR
jgi:hypothetical protein